VGYEISATVGFAGLGNINDGRFSMSVGFVLLRVGFGGLRDLRDCRFSVSVIFFVTRFQRQLVLFCFVVSRFWWVMRSQ